MPTVTIEGPPLKNVDTKRILTKEITESTAKAYQLTEDVIVVVIKENLPENVSVGGQLIMDRPHNKSE